MPTLQEEYFQSYSDYFWQWEEQQSVLSIPGESTIAYTEFVSEAMAALAPQGLPPFGSLLLAIVATNPRPEESLEEINKIILSSLVDTTEDMVQSAMVFLLTLSKLPEAYKTGQKRLMVLQAIFRDCHYIRSIGDSNVLSTIIAHSTFSKRISAPLPFNQKNYYRDFRVVSLLDSKFPSPSSIIDRVANLPALEKEQLKLEDNTGSKKTKEDLVDQLIDNSKTFHIGSLVKRIWSGLNIPVHSTLPSDQPIGGFSDLSNKGDFDRLLLSEFANDDLLFLSRLANNEALYIEREIPPANNKLERVILMDASLRNWGTPKTVAFATMLAIARHPKTSIACKVYVIGKKFHPVSIENVDKIIEGLQIVEGELHPAKGLDAFFKEFPSPVNREVFVITEPSTLKQGEMLRAMYDHQPLINYVIYTDALGNIDVYKKQQSSKRHIQHLLLPLGELWTKPSPKKETLPSPAGSREHNEQIPQFPILVKPAANTRVLLSTGEGELFQVTPERFLLRFFDKSAKYYAKGWEILYTNLPVISGEFEIGQMDSTITLLMFNPQNKQLHLLNLSNGSITTIAFNQWRSESYGFIFKDGCFLYRNYSGSSNWRIYPDGKLEEIPEPNAKLFIERKKEVQELDKKVYSAGGILKNIDSVYINGENRLVLNIHELHMDQNNYIRLANRAHMLKKNVALREERDSFLFADGSKVEVNRSGFVILRSSNPSIPPIYVPTMMDATLGIATYLDFAGNTYYHREGMYVLKLEKAGTNKLALIKSIKSINNQSLVTVKDLVDSGSGIICSYLSLNRAEELQKELELQDAKTEIWKMQEQHRSEQRVIQPGEFFDLHINPFINHILAHGA